MQEGLLALETRRRLYEVVRGRPGVAAREVQRLAGTAWGETAYHLERLVEAGLLHRESGGHQDHYFAASVPLGDRRLLRLAQSASARRLLAVLFETPDSTVPELVEKAGLSPGRLSVHLRRLLETGLAESGRRGRFRTYALRDPQGVARVLITYRQGVGDEWIERLFSTWAELLRP